MSDAETGGKGVSRRALLHGLALGGVSAAALAAPLRVARASGPPRQAQQTKHLDLTNPADCLNAFVRMQAPLSGANAVYYFKGSVYGYVPGVGNKFLFGFEGHNVRRLIPIDGGYQLLSREAVFYTDPKTGQPLDCWDNPYTGKTVEVVHVWNDPVNNKFLVQGQFGPFQLPFVEFDGIVQFASDVPLAYPSPLPRDQYAPYSQNDLYQGFELFHFFARRDQLDDPDLDQVESDVSWARVGPWLPWMEMADAPGALIYHASGRKLDGGYAEVPAAIANYVLSHQPRFQYAPERPINGPNSTSWSYFKKVVDAGLRGQGCGSGNYGIPGEDETNNHID